MAERKGEDFEGQDFVANDHIGQLQAPSTADGSDVFCSRCDITFDNLDQLYEHHMQSPSHRYCTLIMGNDCDYDADSIESFHIHLKSAECGVPCHGCNLGFTSIGQLEGHLVTAMACTVCHEHHESWSAHSAHSCQHGRNRRTPSLRERIQRAPRERRTHRDNSDGAVLQREIEDHIRMFSRNASFGRRKQASRIENVDQRDWTPIVDSDTINASATSNFEQGPLGEVDSRSLSWVTEDQWLAERENSATSAPTGEPDTQHHWAPVPGETVDLGKTDILDDAVVQPNEPTSEEAQAMGNDASVLRVPDNEADDTWETRALPHSPRPVLYRDSLLEFLESQGEIEWVADNASKLQDIWVAIRDSRLRHNRYMWTVTRGPECNWKNPLDSPEVLDFGHTVDEDGKVLRKPWWTKPCDPYWDVRNKKE